MGGGGSTNLQIWSSDIGLSLSDRLRLRGWPLPVKPYSTQVCCVGCTATNPANSRARLNCPVWFPRRKDLFRNYFSIRSPSRAVLEPHLCWDGFISGRFWSSEAAAVWLHFHPEGQLSQVEKEMYEGCRGFEGCGCSGALHWGDTTCDCVGGPMVTIMILHLLWEGAAVKLISGNASILGHILINIMCGTWLWSYITLGWGMC